MAANPVLIFSATALSGCATVVTMTASAVGLGADSFWQEAPKVSSGIILY